MSATNVHNGSVALDSGGSSNNDPPNVSTFNTIVRVKRKRTEMPVAPEFLVFPRAVDKRARVADDLFASLRIDGESGDDGGGGAAATQQESVAGNEPDSSDAVAGPQGVVCALVETDDAGVFL
jgi:hypothetical protein